MPLFQASVASPLPHTSHPIVTSPITLLRPHYGGMHLFIRFLDRHHSNRLAQPRLGLLKFPRSSSAPAFPSCHVSSKLFATAIILPNPRHPQRGNVKSKIFRIGTAQSSTGISRGDAQEVDMAWLKRPYERMEEEEMGKSGRESVIRDLGSKRTVGIETATRHQLYTKSFVASIV